MYLPVTALGLMFLGQADGVAAADAVDQSFQSLSLWDLATKGGVMMIPIGVCSMVALAVIAERLITLRRGKIIPAKFLPGLRASLGGDGDSTAAALEYCKSNRSPIANIFAAGIRRLAEPIELLEKHIQEAGQREVLKLRKYLRLLALIASISPLLGLLGTIFGMIKAFQTVAMSGEALGKAELLATGIYEAMITTAAGLCVAIPVLIGFHWISARIDSLVAELDQMTCEFVEEFAYSVRGEDSAEPRLQPVQAEEQEEDEADQATSVSSA